MNVSILSAQDIHDHIGKYVSIPESWHSKNYGFEFVKCINAVVQKEVMRDLSNASYHTLIANESTDVSVIKTLILYARPCLQEYYSCEHVTAQQSQQP